MKKDALLKHEQNQDKNSWRALTESSNNWGSHNSHNSQSSSYSKGENHQHVNLGSRSFKGGRYVRKDSASAPSQNTT